MTTVELHDHNDCKEIHIHGHSGYSEPGSDIVCAGISALAESFTILASYLEEEGRVEIWKLQQDSGVLDLTVYDPDHVTDEAFRMLKCGLYEIQKKFFENLTVTG